MNEEMNEEMNKKEIIKILFALNHELLYDNYIRSS